MKILLYDLEEINTFLLPNQISGSFCFDSDPNEEYKLINIEERNGCWVLYNTNNVRLTGYNNEVSEVVLQEYSYYYLERNKKIYLIYVLPAIETYRYFSYDDKLNITVGSNNSCNIVHNAIITKEYVVRLLFENEKLILQNYNGLVFVNNNKLLTEKIIIKSGDEIVIFGIKILVLDSLLFVRNVPNNLLVNGLISYEFPIEEKPKNIEIEDVSLYKEDDYFSKSPRFRRIINRQDVKLSAPPREDTSSKMPLILTIGPMLTMGITSGTMLLSTVLQLKSGETTIEKTWPQLLGGGAMLISMLIWPLATQWYNKNVDKKNKILIEQKYDEYLKNKRIELNKIKLEQQNIMIENLVNLDACVQYIHSKGINFWDKRNDQSDFLNVRLGVGDAPLEINLSYEEEDFSIDESNLKDKAESLIKEFKFVENTPIGYSFYKNIITAVMGDLRKSIPFVNNILLQLMTFYSYEDLKFVIFTTKKNEKKWSYLRYLNHTFNNEKNFRFFSTSHDSSKIVSEYLMREMGDRIKFIEENKDKSVALKPHYFIVVDGYDQVKRSDLVSVLSELDYNIGFSVVIIEERLSNLPSKCSNFINLGDPNSGILKNSYENQEIIKFKDEIKYNINYMELAKEISNVPIEFDEKVGALPETISFLEMENVGKVEQLNVLNRWYTNDSTQSLRAEIGVDEHKDLMYLDLHEKFHGPHGLIAGTTGSGKSEFIITYILSMAINYSPDDVAFILIDYKGGGLTGAFENRTTGVVLPHLVGTITNLDKAEMDRTLVSIDSEVKRRQKKFNEVKDNLNESTIDIYKYQKFYKEGKVSDPIPHLFIISDEFAELKSQQPEFMDNLISVARIGRSLGVHLILATQKPSGVVNDQIWSNSKFKVCLKVQDEADSKEILKNPDAAHIREAGRFYLQVGYDEYYAMGQSGYCGAKYYPSNTIVKSVDKSVNIIDECGNKIKSIQAGNNIKKDAHGEQIASIMEVIIKTAKQENKIAKKLWLENIPPVILEDEIEKKYGYSSSKYQVEAILGEYDAPSQQKQGILTYNFLNDGNTIIYGNDSSESEMLLDSIIYSTTKNHTSDEINYYIVDYGSESLRKYDKLPHIGDMVFIGEDERYNNLLKLLKKEILKRKKILSDFGGEYKNYIKNSGKKMPIIVVIMNNFDSISDSNQNVLEELPDMVRDTERYGVIYILTATGTRSVYSKILQNFSNYYAFKLNDISDYMEVFSQRNKIYPRDFLGRGICKLEDLYEFQACSIVKNFDDLNVYIDDFIKQQQTIEQTRAKKIPVLPEYVRFNYIEEEISDIKNIPVAVSKAELEIQKINILQDNGCLISSNKLINTNVFVKSLLKIFSRIKNISIIIIDAPNQLELSSAIFPNYYTSKFDEVITNINTYIKNLIQSNSSQEGIILINGIGKLVTKLDNKLLLNDLMDNVKKYEKIGVFGVEELNKIKQYTYEAWFTNVFSINSGIWIGRGLSDQSLFRISTITKEMMNNIPNSMGYLINDNFALAVKFIDFVTQEEENGK